MKTTADWNDSPPINHSMTGHRGYSGYWACRKVRKNGTIQIGQIYRAPWDASIQPEPGEWLLFYKYSDDTGSTQNIYEWTCPVDPDGFYRRMFWEPVNG